MTENHHVSVYLCTHNSPMTQSASRVLDVPPPPPIPLVFSNQVWSHCLWATWSRCLCIGVLFILFYCLRLVGTIDAIDARRTAAVANWASDVCARAGDGTIPAGDTLGSASWLPTRRLRNGAPCNRMKVFEYCVQSCKPNRCKITCTISD